MSNTERLDEPTNDRRRPAESEAASVAFGGADEDFNTDEFHELTWVEDPIAPGIQHLSDADNLRSHARIAHLVAAHSIDQLMHVAGVGWYVWIGTHWERDVDDKRARAAVMGRIRGLSVDALTDRDLLADLRQAQTASDIRGVLELMGALTGVRATVDELDADPYLLNVANGTLDLREFVTDDPATVVELGHLQLHQHNPANKITRITNARFDPVASSDLWEKSWRPVCRTRVFASTCSAPLDWVSSANKSNTRFRSSADWDGTEIVSATRPGTRHAVRILISRLRRFSS
jgi:putative DNA primase/helicase